jgi:ketosteroid isomerase-like protein
MTHDDVQAWLDRYIAAWRANERDLIRDLFSEDVAYSYRPWEGAEHTVRGREALVDDWLKEPDQPDGWDAKYEPYAVDGDRAVATGWSRYAATGDEPERTYHNAYLLRFDADGRCAEFREYYMLEGS